MNARTRPARPTLQSLARDTRGATMVEYALMLTLIVVAVAPMARSLGKTVRTTFQAAAAGFTP